jgi:hypothetical protein
MKMKGAIRCKKCRPQHVIVPEGYFGGPPTDLELFKLVRGKKVEIKIGPAFKDTVTVGLKDT